MKKIAFWAAAWLVAWTAAALEYKTVDIRRTGSSPVRETFWAGDSIDFGYALEEDSDAYDLTPWDLVTWELCTYTNPAQLWMGVEGQVDDARAGELSVRTHLPLSVVPEGQYRGYVKGLKVTESNTVASQRVLVEQVVTVRYGQTEFPPDAEDTGDIIAGNAYARISDVEAEEEERQHADNILSNAIAVISSAGGGEPIWSVGYLPADEDERAEGDTNVAYTVEYPVTFLGPLRTQELDLPVPADSEDDDSLPMILTPFAASTNNGLARFRSRSRSFGSGLVLNSTETFLRMALGDYASLVLSQETLRKAKATLSAEGNVEVKGERVTITAEVYDEEEDETVPGTIELDGNVTAGNVYMDGTLGVDGNANVQGDMQAETFTLNGVTIDEWPSGGDSEAVEELREAVAANTGNIATNESRIEANTSAIVANAGNIATNAEAIADLRTAAGNLQLAVNAAASGVASNANRIAAVNTRIDTRIDGLYGECKGGWKWPDYFRVLGYATGVKETATTNETLFATNTVYNIVETLATNTTMKGWQINPEIVRKENENDAILWEPCRLRWIDRDKTHMPVVRFSMDPDLLEASGNNVYFKDGVEPEAVDASFAMVRGTLGSHTVDVRLDYDSALQATNNVVGRFVGPAPGSLMAQCWSNIFETASNGWAQTPRRDMGLRLWPEGYGSATNHVTATWNTNFWAYGLGDFSCISYHSDAKPGFDGGVYRPITMVTPRHGIGANHYLPMTGSNCYWVTRGGTVVTNRIVSRKNIRGDLTVVRLDHAFDTNDIMPAKLLEIAYSGYLYGSTNVTHDCIGFPVLSFDCAERGWVSGWKPAALYRGRDGESFYDAEESFFVSGAAYAGNAKYEGPYKGNGGAVGGDSGSPTFLLIDGQTILLGCFHTAPGGGPMPNKSEVDEVIVEWGDEERCESYNLGAGHWDNPDMPGIPH